jgi:gentisate 1,2-dioxygenase
MTDAMTDRTSAAPAAPASGDWSAHAVYYEYSQAADPIRGGQTTQIPARQFSADSYAGGPTRIVPLDLSADLRTPYAATSPALLANYLVVRAGDRIGTDPNATSQLYYCLSGSGTLEVLDRRTSWAEGDFITLPSGSPAVFEASADAAFYWVHDEPLLSFLGVTASERRFEPTVFPKARAVEELAKVAADPEAGSRSRVSILLANDTQDQTLTITHVLWAMFGILPEGKVQPPHRHQSVALDLILDCRPGCYTLLGSSLDDNGQLVDPVRIDWESGAAFVTPPGKWHSHHNESGADAHLIPIQDAGLQTYLRSLDIQFTFNQPQAEQAAETTADISPATSAG